MHGTLAVITGAVLGIVASLPAGVLFERALKRSGNVSVGAGLLSILASFGMLSVGIVVVRLAAREYVLLFGTAEAASFLLVWAVEAIRAWRDAQRGTSKRKEEW